MQDEKLCPICKNHCSLTKPKCGRGKKYAETIELPIKSNDKDKKSKHICFPIPCAPPVTITPFCIFSLLSFSLSYFKIINKFYFKNLFIILLYTY